jgi:urease subunit alpha
VTFMAQAAIDGGVPEALGLRSRVLPVSRTRDIGKRDMVRNDATPVIDVDPETYAVTVDGEPASIAPAVALPLTQLFFLV